VSRSMSCVSSTQSPRKALLEASPASVSVSMVMLLFKPGGSITVPATRNGDAEENRTATATSWQRLLAAAKTARAKRSKLRRCAARPSFLPFGAERLHSGSPHRAPLAFGGGDLRKNN